MLTRAQRDKWAEELESGKWKQQCDGGYFKGDACCCLGVLALMLQAQGETYLVRAMTPNEMHPFVVLNDHQKLPFPEIAKHVRSLPVSDEPQP